MQRALADIGNQLGDGYADKQCRDAALKATVDGAFDLAALLGAYRAKQLKLEAEHAKLMLFSARKRYPQKILEAAIAWKDAQHEADKALAVARVGFSSNLAEKLAYGALKGDGAVRVAASAVPAAATWLSVYDELKACGIIE